MTAHFASPVSEEKIFEILDSGNTQEALQALCALIDGDQKNLTGRFFRAKIFRDAGFLDAALIDLEVAIERAPDFALAQLLYGEVLFALNRQTEARVAFERAVSVAVPAPEAWIMLGNMNMDAGNVQDAITAYQSYLLKTPANHSIRLNLSIGQQQAGLYLDAIENLKIILNDEPENMKALEVLGSIYLDLGEYDSASEQFEKSGKIDPESLNAWNGKGLVHIKKGKFDEAIECFDRIKQLYPDLTTGYLNAGHARILRHDYEGALEDIEHALLTEHYPPSALGDFIHIKRQTCDWDKLDEIQSKALSELNDGNLAAFPFNLIAWTNDAALLKDTAEKFCAVRCPPLAVLEPISPYQGHEKIRIGYFSADFYEHATMVLMARLFELHDRSKFEIYGFSFGPSKQDYMRERAEKAFDHFIDVSQLTDRATALLARHFEIDLAIDMKGYTTHCRPGIFAYRAAPVQINYLGFPGTMGAPYIDYLIADAEIIPPNADHHYSEKILRLPGCYQVNDEFRTKTGRTFTRAMLGLPEDAFVFCSFNNNYKIDPKIFDIWCRLLNRVPDSVLWIMADNKLAMENLKAEATKRGVAEGKLIFTPRCSLADHISRQEHGDLLLDTFPCNAHTTASDALFAGLPLLTLRGETFSSRVAASILKAVGLDDFITDTYESYEEKAFQLAHERGRLQAIKQALRTHIKSSDLYNTTRFTKNYEECLMRIYQESQQA